MPALPLAFGLAYLATRLGGPADRAAPIVQPQAVGVQVLPYLGVVALLAALTLPPAWSGLQPVDGLILVAAWAVYFARAVRRRPRSGRGRPLPAPAIRRALAASLPAVALGGLASVLGAQKVGAALGWPDLVVGLFLIGFLCAVPEACSAWRFARRGRPTVAVSSATADGIVSLTLALVPSALTGAVTGNVAVYAVNLAFLGLVLAAYAFLNHRRRGRELGPGFVAVFGTAYLGYAAVMACLILAG